MTRITAIFFAISPFVSPPHAHALRGNCIPDQLRADLGEFIQNYQKAPVSLESQSSYMHSAANPTHPRTVIVDLNTELKYMNDHLFEGIGGKELANAVHHRRFETLLRTLKEDPVFSSKINEVYCDFKTGRIEIDHDFEKFVEDQHLQSALQSAISNANQKFINDSWTQNVITQLREKGASASDIARFKHAYITGVGHNDTYGAIAARENRASGYAVFDAATTRRLEQALRDSRSENDNLVQLMNRANLHRIFFEKSPSGFVPNEKLCGAIKDASEQADPRSALFNTLKKSDPSLTAKESGEIFDSFSRLDQLFSRFATEGIGQRTILDYSDPTRGGVFSVDIQKLGVKDRYERGKAILLSADSPDAHRAIASVLEASASVTRFKNRLFASIDRSLQKVSPLVGLGQKTGDDYINRVPKDTQVEKLIRDSLNQFRAEKIDPSRVRTVYLDSNSIARIESAHGEPVVDYIVRLEKTLKQTTANLQHSRAGPLFNETFVIPVVRANPSGKGLFVRLIVNPTHADPGFLKDLEIEFETNFAKNFPGRRANDLPISFENDASLGQKVLRIFLVPSVA